MKKLITLITILGYITLSLFAQAPKGFKFQAIARDKDGIAIAGKTVQLRISIIRGNENGDVVYTETHLSATNMYGLVDLEIGSGVVEKGDFKSIEWGSASHYVKLEMDENGGSNFKDLGTSELLSVPYAMYADKAGNQPKGVEWTVNGSSIYSNYTKVGIGTQNSTAALEITSNILPGSPANYSTQIGVGQMTLASGVPYIDFNTTANGSTDYNARMQYISSGDYISLVSAGLRIYSGQPLYVESQSGFGTTAPNSSAKVDITSTTQGFLPPRMTTAQRNAISSPATGLQVYNSETNCLNFYTPNGWFEVCGEPLTPTSPCGGISSVEYNGKVYTTVAIGTQCWLGQNLNTTKYRNGDNIPNVTDNTAWGNLTTGAYCDYNNDANNASVYGRLYNWYTVDDSRNLCPTGWHVPSDTEWTTLTTYLGGESIAGGKLKETGTAHWNTPNTGATNETGFTSIPGGIRDNTGYFNVLGDWDMSFCSTSYSSTHAYNRYINFLNPAVGNSPEIGNKKWGVSIRCLKD